ncbi:CNH domain-containing protein [Dactylonectria estremocensis]|uniref:CNH domain-containing protein n=1 Tax=Dactylonectria estremocensis TaxID=1079267 RepID=A0A9P9J5M8_9HYPO|nr:CNH domain-containing protein [Dactylonectria estremocensis]
MLLTLRIISIDVAVETTSDQQSMSGGTDNQLSRVASSHGALDMSIDALEKLSFDEDSALDSTSELGSQGAIPDSEELIDWDALQATEGDPLADDFLQQAVQNGAFQSHLANDASIHDELVLPFARRRLVPSELTAADFQRCVEPWALSSIEAWLREIGEGEPDLKAKMIDEALVLLFTNKVPTIKVADAETLSHHVLALLHQHGVLVPDEEWVKFEEGRVSGVLWQMTGSGCYAPRVHDAQTDVLCYSYYCDQNIEKLDLDRLLTSYSGLDWVNFYRLKREDLENVPKKEVHRQNILHEIVASEENYIRQLHIFDAQYQEQIRVHQPPIVAPEKKDHFLETVFGKFHTIQDLNQNLLLAQLKHRQQKQGPWISGFSDLFREWIRKAQPIYTEYAATYPLAVWMMRTECDTNLLFRHFLKSQVNNRVRLDWDHYLISPIQRIQRYVLLLEAVECKTVQESEEKLNLRRAIAEIKAVLLLCDTEMDAMNKKVVLMDLKRKLVLRPGFPGTLNLGHANRELVFQGDVITWSSNALTTRQLPARCLLFDHYLLLAKELVPKYDGGEKKLDVSKEPIPLYLLSLEIVHDSVSQWQNAGEHIYKFKIKHLGHRTYTLGTFSAKERDEWVNKIIQAKVKHAEVLYSQRSEPFRLRVLSDFIAGRGSPDSVLIRGTPLSRALQEPQGLSNMVHPLPDPGVQINCSTDFTVSGKHVFVIGTDSGVRVFYDLNPRVDKIVLEIPRVTQIAVLEELSICVLITDKTLVYCPLQEIVNELMSLSGDKKPQITQHRVSKDVTYFATAKMKDRMLLFYKRKELLRTSFKVIELGSFESSETKSRLFARRTSKGHGSVFREYDEFTFAQECYSLSLFQTYIAGATAKGMELLTLDKKQPFSVPPLNHPETANITNRIRGQRPLGMFTLNSNEFIIPYETVALYIDKHGDISRSVILGYAGKQAAQDATMYEKYLLLFYDDYVEIREAENGWLRQIIPGQDIRVLDHGVRGPRSDISLNPSGVASTSNSNGGSRGTVKIAMSNPKVSGNKIVLELLLDDRRQE